MTIIQLEYLLAVANCGSFSLAAEHCFVTQPSLSMQIKSLEEELGVVLLDRSKKPVIPTEAGEVVLAEIRETLRAYDHIREAVAELKGETSGRLRLGVIPTIAPYLLHKFIPDFVRDYPKVELEIAEMVTADIVDALAATGSMRHWSPAEPAARGFRNTSCSTTGSIFTCPGRIRFSNARTSVSRISTSRSWCC